MKNIVINSFRLGFIVLCAAFLFSSCAKNDEIKADGNDIKTAQSNDISDADKGMSEEPLRLRLGGEERTQSSRNHEIYCYYMLMNIRDVANNPMGLMDGSIICVLCDEGNMSCFDQPNIKVFGTGWHDYWFTADIMAMSPQCMPCPEGPHFYWMN